MQTFSNGPNHADSKRSQKSGPNPASAFQQLADFENAPASVQTLRTQQILNLQRTIGNQATIQLLRKPIPILEYADEETEFEANRGNEESAAVEAATLGPAADVNRLLQRVPMMTSDAMLAVSPYTTNIFGKKKSSAYNHLVDAVKRYWTIVNGGKRELATVQSCLNIIVIHADAWWAKHSASTASKYTVKKAAVGSVRDTAKALKAALIASKAQLMTDTHTVHTMYANPALWALLSEWATNQWYLDDNTHFVQSVKTFNSVAEGKAIIAKHLLHEPISGQYPVSPELFNVSDDFFARAKALILTPDSTATVLPFRTLFDDCLAGASHIFGDFRQKMTSDQPQGARDSFLFSYARGRNADIGGPA